MDVDVNPPSAVLLASPPAAPVPARSWPPCAQRVGGELKRRDPAGPGGAGEGSEVGLKEKDEDVPWALGSRGQPLLRWWGQREPEEQAARVSVPQRLRWEAPRDIGVPRCCRKGASLREVVAAWCRL